MSDKFLSEGEWKKFSRGRTVKDAKFLKVLADLDKAKTPEQQLPALAEIRKESELLRKVAKGDKEFLAYVDGLDKAIAREEKLAKEKESEQDEDEGEEESPVLLTSKMIPLLRQVKKGEEMQVLVANAGTEVAVLMSRRPISPSRRKLLSEYLDGTTPKYLPGICIMEENAYTFVLKTKAAGLAKKIKAALLKQVDLRLKVRVRGEEADDIDDDGEPEEGNEGLAAEGEESNAGATTAIPTPPPPDPLKLQFDKRWAALEARVLERLKAGAGDVSKLRAVAEFVREKGDAGNYKAALQGMESLEKLLPAATAPATAAKSGTDPAAAFTARLAALMPAAKTAIAAGGDEAQDLKLKISEAGVFARKKEFEQANALLDEAETLMESVGQDSVEQDQDGVEEEAAELDAPADPATAKGFVNMQRSRLLWSQTRQTVKGELAKLENSILTNLKDAPDFAGVQHGVRRLDQVLAVLDDELTEILDRALNAQDPAERGRLSVAAREQVQAYRDYVTADKFVAELDANPFTPIKIRETVTRSLTALDKALV